MESIIVELNNIIDGLRKRKIPNEYPYMEYIDRDAIPGVHNKYDMEIYINTFNERMDQQMKVLSLRDSIIELQGFALVSRAWVKPLAKFITTTGPIKDGRVVELMSGLGTLSYALIQEGLVVLPTDDDSWTAFSTTEKRWVHTMVLDAADAIMAFRADYYIMSWPNYQSDIAYKVLMALRKYRPDSYIIYIGEGDGGCTGDDMFYNEMQVVDNEEFEKVADMYNSFMGIHDRLWLIK